MANKFYVDTSVWRDYFEDRKDNMKPLGEFAFQFLQKCVEEKHKIIVSDEIIRELRTYYSDKKIRHVFSEFMESIILIEYNNHQYLEARNFWIKSNKKFPRSDILHSIIARDNQAILISRDHHFEEINIVECKTPEEID